MTLFLVKNEDSDDEDGEGRVRRSEVLFQKSRKIKFHVWLKPKERIFTSTQKYDLFFKLKVRWTL